MATWDGTFNASPTASANPAQGDDRIRETRSEAQQRMEHEHAWLNTGTTTGGVHREGSAKIYYEDSEPENKPNSDDGVLTSADAGRLWKDSDDLGAYVYDGSSFVKLDPIIENKTSDPTSPVTGQIWLRTDLV